MLVRANLDARFWATAVAASLASFVVLAIPTAVIENPFFTRMTPTEPFMLVTLVASVPLFGLLAATYLAPVPGAASDPGEGRGRATTGGVAAFLAIGCPICNKLVVAALGVGGAMQWFAPLQPLLGAASIALVAVTLAWRLRLRAARCTVCAAA